MKFSDIKKFIQTGNWQADFGIDDFVSTIDKWVNEWELELNPDFQRGHVWNEEQQVAWVEFILRGGITGNVVYLNEGRTGFVCVDGLQRITAMSRFVKNEIKAFGHYYNEYEDKSKYFDVSLKINRNNLQTKKEILQWYLEMNGGGVVHTKEELDRVRTLLEKEINNK